MARQLLPEGSCGNSGLAQIARAETCMFKPRELKVISREGLRISLGIQMLEQLANCFLKVLVENPDSWISLATLKSSKSYRMSYYTFIVHAW